MPESLFDLDSLIVAMAAIRAATATEGPLESSNMVAIQLC